MNPEGQEPLKKLSFTHLACAHHGQILYSTLSSGCARVERRKKEWATTRMNRCLVVELVNTAVEIFENIHLTEMLTDVMEEAGKRVEVNQLLGEMDGDMEIQSRVLRALGSRRREEDGLVKATLLEEKKQQIKQRIFTVRGSDRRKPMPRI